jgi:hypothetical protein
MLIKLKAGFQRDVCQLSVVQATHGWMQVYVYSLNLASRKRDCESIINVLSSNSLLRHCEHSGEFG